MKKSKWKRILAGMGIILTLSDLSGANVWQLQAADVISEYTETKPAEEQSFDWQEEKDEEKSVDQEDQREEGEEEQILDGQEDSSPEAQIQATEGSPNWVAVEVPNNTELITEESAEAGAALDGGFLTDRGIRRSRMAAQFQNCYGDQLGEGTKEVYDAMTAAWSGGGTSAFTVKFQEPLTFQATGAIVDGKWKWIAEDAETTAEKMELDPAFGETVTTLRCYVQGGFDACIYDHPEIFWLKNVSYSYGRKWEVQDDGTVTGKIMSVTVSGNEAWTGARDCVPEFQEMAEDAAESIRDSFTDGITDAQKMKRIHDYICAKCVYQEGTCAHSAYGTFYDGKVVCEGYAKAFKILCDKMGLVCVLGSGTVHKFSSDGAHMWNYVLLDGGWYMVDATWDDGSTLSNRYLFAGAQTEGFYYPIAQERTNYTIFSNNTAYGFQFVQPTLQENTYHEMTETGQIPASCENDGLQTQQCQLCDEIKQETIPATGHNFDSWKVTTAATCEQAGVQSRSCQICGRTETKVLLATGHSYGSWQINRTDTALKEGEMCRTCQNDGCSSVQTRMIAKLPGFVQLNASSITLQTKQSTSGVKVTAMAAGDRIVSWKSSRPSVAAVSKNGRITGKKAGTAVISVTLASGVTGKCKVKVQKKAVAAAGLEIACSGLQGSQLTLKKGQSVSCKATVKPFTCKTKVTYTSGNKKIAKVSASGRIRGIKKGKTRIIIQAGKKKKVIWLTVKQN